MSSEAWRERRGAGMPMFLGVLALALANCSSGHMAREHTAPREPCVEDDPNVSAEEAAAMEMKGEKIPPGVARCRKFWDI